MSHESMITYIDAVETASESLGLEQPPKSVEWFGLTFCRQVGRGIWQELDSAERKHNGPKNTRERERQQRGRERTSGGSSGWFCDAAAYGAVRRQYGWLSFVSPGGETHVDTGVILEANEGQHTHIPCTRYGIREHGIALHFKTMYIQHAHCLSSQCERGQGVLERVCLLQLPPRPGRRR